MEITTLALLVTWCIIIPLLILFPPKNFTWLQKSIRKQRNRRAVKNATLDPSWWKNPSEANLIQNQQEHANSKLHTITSDETQSSGCETDSNAATSSSSSKFFSAASSASEFPPPASSSDNANNNKKNKNNNLLVIPKNKNLVLVFVNPKSGGRLGDDLLLILKQILAPTQVYDITQKDFDPKTVLQNVVGNARIIVCGGDGTVSWIVTCCCAVKKFFPIGILPLGTGNDLSRSFGWSGGAGVSEITKEYLTDFVARVLASKPGSLDLFEVTITSLSSSSSSSSKNKNKSTTEEPETLVFPMLNYFSVGIDAQICANFHRERQDFPNSFSSQQKNILIYARLGLEQSFQSYPLGNKIRDVRGKNSSASSSAQSTNNSNSSSSTYITKQQEKQSTNDEEIIEFNPAHKCFIVSNCCWYQGGKDFWGKSEIQEHDDFLPSRSDDGKLEVMAMSGTLHFGLSHIGLDNAIRLAQVETVSFELTEEQWMQIDGEPIYMKNVPARVNIRQTGRYPILNNVLSETSWMW